MIVQEGLVWPSTNNKSITCSYIINGDILQEYTTPSKQHPYQEQDVTCVKPEHMTLSYVSSIMEEQEEEQEQEKKKKKKPPPPTPKKRLKKRTVTSYDYETSFYLKSVFFEVYSYQKKLTKQQRKEVQKKTGLASRNITYWFSNHKRRFHKTLKVYRDTVENSNGFIKNYHDFLIWRREKGLPDQISLEETQ